MGLPEQLNASPRKETGYTHQLNCVNQYITEGLPTWEKTGAHVSMLVASNGVEIPVIETRAAHPSITILIASGLHLEETGGPYVALQPDVFEPWINRGVNFLIFPVINQYGLHFPETAAEIFLRNDEQGRSYNDGWGDCDPSRKPYETYPIEQFIQTYHTKNPFKLALSLHEDSITPGRGYFYTYGLSPQFRDDYYDQFLQKQSKQWLASLNANPEPTGGYVEKGCFIVDDQDEFNLETWLYHKMSIPTLLIEGPFGLDLVSRASFTVDAINTALGLNNNH